MGDESPWTTEFVVAAGRQRPSSPSLLGHGVQDFGWNSVDPLAVEKSGLEPHRTCVGHAQKSMLAEYAALNPKA